MLLLLCGKRAERCFESASLTTQRALDFLLLSCSLTMEIIKSIRTWKPLKKSKSAQSNKSDSSDNYCFSEPKNTTVQCQDQHSRRSQTSLESDSLYSPTPTRPASSAAALQTINSSTVHYQNVEPLTKPPPHFMRPKQQAFQGKKLSLF